MGNDAIDYRIVGEQGDDAHFCLAFGTDHGINFVDLPEDAESPILDGLGPEPLDLELRRFEELLSSRSARLKSLLLDQSFVAGVGNIYADEILFRAGLQPIRSAEGLKEGEVRRLWKAILDTLLEAIDFGGTPIRSFVDVEGKKGEFQSRHRVYGRVSQPCISCGRPIQRIRQVGEAPTSVPAARNEGN